MTYEKLSQFFKTLDEELDAKSLNGYAESTRFAIQRLKTRMRKRARFNDKDLKVKAVNDFVVVNEFMRTRPAPTLSKLEVAEAKAFITNALERFSSRIDEDNVQTVLDLRFIFDNWRFGPGASHEVKGTHCAEKLRQPLTCNKFSAPLVTKVIEYNHYLSRFDYGTETGGISIIRGSRLDTVLKNEDTNRTIAIEPSGQMALQLAAGRYLEEALRCIGLDIQNQQPRNKELARIGSFYGSFATIDMKSASDMISLDLVRLLMPREWVWLLETLRSREIKLPNGDWIELNMISTMGNGFTFPLMTLIITSLIYAVRRLKGGPNQYIDWSCTCVFGDDVIVPTDEYESVVDILSRAGFVINTDKSYCEGPFRESCGGDYYKGVDVTPFYVKSLSTPSQVYTAINQLLDWSVKTEVLLYRSLSYLINLLRPKDPFLVPEWMNPDQGIQTSQCSRRYKYLSIQPYRRRLLNEDFLMMLACGNYVVSSGPDVFYMPRVRVPKYVVRKSRLPRGYCDGWDPGKGSSKSSALRSLMVNVAML